MPSRHRVQIAKKVSALITASLATPAAWAHLSPYYRSGIAESHSHVHAGDSALTAVALAGIPAFAVCVAAVLALAAALHRRQRCGLIQEQGEQHVAHRKVPSA